MLRVLSWLKAHWLILAILILSLSLRLYRIEATLTFLEDEGRDLLIVKRMVDTSRPVLLGPQTSTGNMYLGPLYYYFITPALVLARMDPVGPAIMIAFSGVLTVYLLYYLGRKWFNPVSAYLSALMFGSLPLSVAFTRASWNPHLVPLITVLMLLVYDRLSSGKPKWYWWLLYGVLVGTMVQLHYMALVFCGVLSLLLVWHYRSRLTHLWRGILAALLGAILILLPFIVFEIRNDWVNTSALTRFLKAKEERNIRYDLPAWLWFDKVTKTTTRVVSNTLVGNPNNATTSALAVYPYLALLVVATISAIKARHHRYLGLVVLGVGSFAVLGVYQENIHLHYLEFALPLIVLLLGGMASLFTSTAWRTIYLIFLVFVFFSGAKSTFALVASEPNHQVTKAKAVADYIVDQARGGEYNVVSTQGTYTTPFQYFLSISDNPPQNSLTSRVFVICSGEPCPLDDETTTLLFLTGPGHPAIFNYLGHPELNSFEGERQMINNQHVSIGIWVAEIVLK